MYTFKKVSRYIYIALALSLPLDLAQAAKAEIASICTKTAVQDGIKLGKAKELCTWFRPKYVQCVGKAVKLKINLEAAENLCGTKDNLDYQITCASNAIKAGLSSSDSAELCTWFQPKYVQCVGKAVKLKINLEAAENLCDTKDNLDYQITCASNAIKAGLSPAGAAGVCRWSGLESED